jgi:hypothetical protein
MVPSLERARHHAFYIDGHAHGQLLLPFPVLGMLKAVVLTWLICRLFPDKTTTTIAIEETLGRLSIGNRR